MELVEDQLCEISYECRVNMPGDDPECGIVVGRWTGDIDYVGKRTIKVEDRDERIFLFEDEILEVEPYTEAELHEDRMRLVSVKATERETLASQCRAYVRAVAALHSQHRVLMGTPREFDNLALSPEKFKKAVEKVKSLETVLEARLRGL